MWQVGHNGTQKLTFKSEHSQVLGLKDIIFFTLQPHAPMVQWMRVADVTKLLPQVLHFLLMELRKHAGTSITGILQTSPLSVYLLL